MRLKRFWKWYYLIPLGILLAPVVIALVIVVFGGIVMLLWNWLLPDLFGWPEITLLQGFGLLVLTRILFGGFGGGGGGGHHSKGMSDAERRRVRERMCRTEPPRPGSEPPIDVPAADR